MNIGNNVRRIREIKGLKQDYLADKLGISQQAYSNIEKLETIADDRLKQIASIMDVPVEAIKNFRDDAIINNFNTHGNNIHNYFSPTEKIVELYDRIIIYEKQLTEKDQLIKNLEIQLKSFNEKNLL